MATWQQQPPPMGFYPGQQDPAAQGYYPNQPGYPPQGGAYPQPPPAYPGAVPGGIPFGGMPPPGGQPPFVAPPPMHPSAAAYGTSYNDDTLTGPDNFDFSSKTIRNGFIRKVYGILMCQLMVSVGFVLLFTYHLPTKQYVRTHSAIVYIAMAIMFITLIAMSCCESVRRKAPTNFIFLGVFTVAFSFCVATTASFYNTDAVLMALSITTVVCLALTIFAFQTKWDFTVLSGSLFVILIVFVLFGFVCMLFPGRILSLVYASLGAVLFSVYLVYDTQLMIGGKHKCSISPEEYVFAALSLYLDIINIFLYILHIIGLSRD